MSNPPVVWLPLNGNLDNNGTSGVPIETIVTAAYSANGKTGKALSGGKIRIPAGYVPQVFNNEAMAIAFWYNNNGSTSSHAICGFAGNSEGESDAVRSYDFFNYPTANDFHYSMGTLGGGTITGAIPDNTWIHFCITWDGTNLKIYVNGELQVTRAGSSNFTFNKAYYINFNHSQMLDDFRIYDTAISPYEVHLLSQGLCLHYPLDQNGRGVVNNIAPSNLTNRNCATYSYDGVDTWTCTAAAESGTWGRGFTISNTSIAIPVGQTWTVELEVNPEVDCTWNCDINNSRDDGVTGSNDNDDGTKRTYSTDGVVTKNLVANKWQKISFSQTAKSDVAIHNAGTNWGIVTGDNAINFQFRRVIGTMNTTSNIWTPYAGAEDTTVYDTSGFGNNGTATNVTYDGDTARYTASSVFDNSTSNIAPLSVFQNGQTMTELTVCEWFNTTTLNSTAPNLWSLGENAFHRLRIASATSVWSYSKVGTVMKGATYSCKTLTDGNWHQAVFTFKNGIITVYIDGEQIGTSDFSSDGTYLMCSSTAWHLGGYTTTGEKYLGKLSDFRLYATALSAEDIKDLYESSTKIHRNGTMYAYSYVEV